MRRFIGLSTLLALATTTAAAPSPRVRPPTSPSSPSSQSEPSPVRRVFSPNEFAEADPHLISQTLSSIPPPQKLDGEYTLRLHWHDVIQFLASPSREYPLPPVPHNHITSKEVNVIVTGDAPPFAPRPDSPYAPQPRQHTGHASSSQSVLSSNFNKNQRASPFEPGQNPLPAGAIYQPGTYPTPDLFSLPIFKHAVLIPPVSHTSEAIQQALDSLGSHSTLYLPPRTHWNVTKTIFLHEHQEIATLGYPDHEDDLAWLDADESCVGNVLNGANKPGVRVRNVGFDGGMERYGPSKLSEAIVQLGNSRGFNQVIDRCTIRHPRGWSSLQVYEGGENVRVTNNRIGPAGYDDSVMGEGYLADGISYAGQHGLVAGNVVTDATDGGIVIFGAPGTLVTSNTIITRTRMNSGAINLVDHAQYKGNYMGVNVVHNTVLLEGSYLNIGVAQGASVWWLPSPDEPLQYNHGAVVRFNLITAQPNATASIGYGFAVSDVQDWTCTDNIVAPHVTFTGDMVQDHPHWRDPRFVSTAPGPFVRAPSRADSGPRGVTTLQPEFVEGPINRLLGIRPGEQSYRAFLPGGQLELGLGEAVVLKRVRLSFDADGELRLSSRGDAGDAVLWEAGCKHRVRERGDSKLVFAADGSLGIVSGSGRMLCLLTPNLAPGIPDLILEVSSEAPHLFIASSVSGSVYWSPMGYEAGHQWQTREGSLVSLGAKDGKTVWLSGVNALGQYVVLKSVGDNAVVPARMPEWPVDPTEWEVDWTSHAVEGELRDPGSQIFFQDDGNLVLYSGTTQKPLWATATDDTSSLVTRLRWSVDETHNSMIISCLDRDGGVAWSTAAKAVPATKP